jgi:hypothetical protein
MNNMTEKFVPTLNQFTVLLKQNYALHLEHIRHLELNANALISQLKTTIEVVKENDTTEINQLLNVPDYVGHLKILQRQINDTKQDYWTYIKATNTMLGSFSNHWGGYIENIGVQYLLNLLRMEYGVHTTIQKYKRWWHKSKNVEIDVVGLSDTHLFIGEVKNQLKEESLKQLFTILEKIKEKVPEYANLQPQPIFVCVHAENTAIEICKTANIWVARYCGFDAENPIDDFEWICKI